MKKESFHTHSIYCDGKSYPEEMIISAVDKGFASIGFSGHSYLDFDCNWCMTQKGTAEYLNDIKILKDKYADKIKIYVGTEYDYFSNVDISDYDYTIGSVHYILKDGNYLPIDESRNCQKNDSDRFFNGSVIDYAVEYFKTVSDVLHKTNADIIGHFDLVTKFNENDCFFSTKDHRYISAWTDAADNLLAYNRPFEINTGAIARNVRKTPYPSLEIAEYINSKGGYFILTSDCHSSDKLDCFYDEVLQTYGKYNIISFEEYLKNKA